MLGPNILKADIVAVLTFFFFLGRSNVKCFFVDCHICVSVLWRSKRDNDQLLHFGVSQTKAGVSGRSSGECGLDRVD